MDVEIKNGGAGPDIGAHVDQNNQMHVKAIDQTVIQDATSKGNSYNINTGTIGLTNSTASSVLYFKNDEDPVNGESTIVIDAIAIGIGDGGTKDEKSIITIVRNPTAGTTVSNANNVDMNQNRNFGSTNTLSSTTLAYKGAQGETLTDGDDFACNFIPDANVLVRAARSGKRCGRHRTSLPRASSRGIRWTSGGCVWPACCIWALWLPVGYSGIARSGRWGSVRSGGSRCAPTGLAISGSTFPARRWW